MKNENFNLMTYSPKQGKRFDKSLEKSYLFTPSAIPPPYII